MTDSRATVRLGLYKRISRDERTGDTFSGLGVARQDKKTRARIDVMNRQSASELFVVVRDFDENNRKATAKERPALTDALNAIKAGELDGIAFYAQDRFTRMPDELEAILKMHKRYPFRLITSTMGEMNLSDPHVVHSMRNAVNNAALELAVMSMRSKDEAEQRALAGKAHGQAPFGWQRVNVFEASGRRSDWYDTLNHPEADLLKDAARQILAGVSLRAIVAGVQDGPVRPRGVNYEVAAEDGSTAVQASGRRWTSEKLSRLLLRPANAGLRLHQGQILDGVVTEAPAIFDVATWTRLRTVLTDPERRTNNVGSKRRWLLSGLLTCATCGDAGWFTVLPPVPSSPHNKAAYQCSGNGHGRGCRQRHPVAQMDAWISVLVEDALKARQYAAPADDSEARLADAYARLDALAAEDLEIAADKEAGRITRPVMLVELAGNAKRRDAITAEIDALLPSTAATLDLPKGFAGATLAEQRAVIQSQFSAIILSPDATDYRGRRGGRAFRPELVQVIPR